MTDHVHSSDRSDRFHIALPDPGRIATRTLSPFRDNVLMDTLVDVSMIVILLLAMIIGWGAISVLKSFRDEND